MSEWPFLTLEEAGVQLLDCAHKTPAAQATGLPYVAIPQLKNGEIDLSDARRISVTDFEEWTKKADPQAYDMVLSRRCNPGETAYVRPGMRFALGQNLVLLRANSKRVRPEFLRWIVRSPYWWAEINKFLNVGAVFDSLRCADVPKFSLPIPPLRHQDAISSLLGAIDDKIDLSSRMNETLEAMARAIFKDWFVDFGPTRAKAEGRAPYLAPKIWALFPERLDDDDKPEGWVIKKVGDVIERLGVGKKYEQKTVFPKGAVPVLDQGKSGIIGYHSEQPGVIASLSRPVIVFANHTCYMRLVMFPFSAIQNVLPFVGKGLNTIWVYYATLDRQEFTEYKGHWPDFVIHEVTMPTQELAEAFSSIVEPFIHNIFSNERENATLAQTREILLPKLMSGEIRLRDAEKILEAVA